MEDGDNAARRPATALHHRIAVAIRDLIAEQGLPPHSKLPSEVALAKQYGVSRGTVTKAMESLVRQGVLYRSRPQGTFVAASIPKPGSASTVVRPSAHASPRTIGLLVPYLPDSFVGNIILGVETVTRTARYGLIFGHSENDCTLERYQIEQLLQAGTAGILIFPGDHAVERREGRLVSTGDLERVETLARLQRQHVPFVLIDRYVPEIDCDYVVSDDSAAGYAATQHLVALGHRWIGFVSDNAQVTSIADRHAGYVQCLQEHGLPVEESLVVQEGRRLGVRGVVGSAQAPGDEFGDRATLHAFLQRPDRPTAIVTTNEYVGLHVLCAAEDVGLDVPGDLAIVSCGGADISTHARVPLTSIRQPAADLGRHAAHLLLDRITGRSSAARHVVVPVSLVVRRSCGARPRRAPLAASSLRT